MSSTTTTYNGNNQVQVQKNFAKLFPFDKELKNYSYNNSTYDTEEIAQGTLMVVNKTTGFVEQFDSDVHTADDYYFVVAGFPTTVEEGDTKSLSVAVAGSRVRENMIVFKNENDDLDTIVGDLRIYEHLLRCGIIPIQTTNATNFDNELS